MVVVMQERSPEQLNPSNPIYKSLKQASPYFLDPKFLLLDLHDSNQKEVYTPDERHRIDVAFLKQELTILGANQELIDLVPDVPDREKLLPNLVQPALNKRIHYSEDEQLLASLLIAFGLLPSHFIETSKLRHLFTVRVSAVHACALGELKNERLELTSASPEVWERIHRYSTLYPQDLFQKYYATTESATFKTRRKGFLSSVRKLLDDGYTFEEEITLIKKFLTAYPTHSNSEYMHELHGALDTQRIHLRARVPDALGVAYITQEDGVNKHDLPGEVRRFRQNHLRMLFQALNTLRTPEELPADTRFLSHELVKYDNQTGKQVKEGSSSTALVGTLENIYRSSIDAEILELMFSTTEFHELPGFIQDFYYWLYHIKKSNWTILKVRDYLSVYKKSVEDPNVTTPGHAALQITYLDKNGKATEIQFQPGVARNLTFTLGKHTTYKGNSHSQHDKKHQELFEKLKTILSQQE